MPRLELLEKPSAFNLNDMMHAIPTRVLAQNPCYVNRMPTEVLARVFEALTQLCGLSLAIPLTISHVCHRWRTVVVNLSSQWTYITINTTRYVDVFTDLVSRSKQRFFVLEINLPSLNIEQCSVERQKEFRDTFFTIRKNITRLRGLQIASNNATLFLIFNKLLERVDYPELEILSIHQLDETARRYTLGPLKLNPHNLSRLALMNIMIECDASCLANLHSIRLVNSSGSFLNQKHLTHSTYPVIPRQPIMMNVRELIIDGMSLLPTDGDFTPSFRASALRTLYLMHISTNTPQALNSTQRLFDAVYSQRLESLTVMSLDKGAFRLFITMASGGQEAKFPHVHNLVLGDVDVEDIGSQFLRAFPAVVSFKIYSASPPHNILGYLTVQQLMPLLKDLDINGRTIPRRPFVA
ncbi:hypothetical protein H0H87_005747 [Tephrocybe sp. NHM501043]|nr:hypothetical protein H0H87_005747 [Tephrocybe sp. NHM501043]